MKFNKIIVLLCFLLFSNLSGNCNTENENAQKIKLNPVLPSDIKISGYPGGKIDLCISERIKNQDIEHLIEQFRHKTETNLWQSEFWGKWMLSAVEAWKYNQDQEWMAILKKADTQIKTNKIGTRKFPAFFFQARLNFGHGGVV